MKIGKIDVPKLGADRDQLWAEAVARFKAGDRWWITNKATLAEADQHQRDRYVGDPWEEVVSSFVERRNDVTVAEILQEALHLDKGRWGQMEQNRIARSHSAGLASRSGLVTNGSGDTGDR